jgi:hypothetical protein
VLTRSAVESLAEAKREIAAWRRNYNETRPHMALNDLTPGEFAGQHSLRPKAHERPDSQFIAAGSFSLIIFDII